MTGQLLYNSDKHKHTHIIFELSSGILHYNDVRKFGYVLYYKNISEAIRFGHFKNIGLEPFEKAFTLEYFQNEIRKKNKSIKTVLLEQSIVVGCGNIYADEICFASKVLPSRNCKTLSPEESKLLYQNIKSILKRAIKEGGSSISDYLLPDGTKGKYANSHKVYGRSGLSCSICGNILEKSIVSGRATVYCDVCQK
jgi:formamidopyrimidine-DNA glycosylase